MATGADVLSMLIPTGGWVIVGDDFEGITFIEAKPITKNEFLKGFESVDSWLEAKQNKIASDRQKVLEMLGITEEQARLLLS